MVNDLDMVAATGQVRTSGSGFAGKMLRARRVRARCTQRGLSCRTESVLGIRMPSRPPRWVSGTELTVHRGEHPDTEGPSRDAVVIDSVTTYSDADGISAR
ncbi:hypothetical protein EF294_12180 [Gordonia oryzae]|uniref:Uncharacterized protein n=1 Tax=Gordonia oryzae TaxID=2487349 RepID=A0A3N4GB23_9ACTN|nr:hypothetical protein EF294_12180 [Gordonia oryzae]